MTPYRLVWLLERPRRLVSTLVVFVLLAMVGWYGLRSGLLADAYDTMWLDLGEVLKGIGPEPTPAP